MTTPQTKSYFYGTGRRKTAVARVRLYPGTGQIVVNGHSPEQHFGARTVYERTVTAPLRLTDTLGRWNVSVKVDGGGTTGQAGAISHGIARALCAADTEAYRAALKKAGMLTRDARVKERKKVGLKRARKAPQYTKR
ncbi:MAG: 30S ribosomal protein S9 [Chloroflexota bacterium]|nr:30S ribosomal protein S9 [Chloroflexota bacterium]